MRPTILVLLMLSVAVPGIACVSFDDCIKSGDDYNGQRTGPISSLEEVKSTQYLRAIAYILSDMNKQLIENRKRDEIYKNNLANELRIKLDEISKRIQQTNNLYAITNFGTGADKVTTKQPASNENGL